MLPPLALQRMLFPGFANPPIESKPIRKSLPEPVPTDMLTFSGKRHRKHRPIIKPAMLEPGDTIALIAPASPVDEEEHQQDVETLKALGYKVKNYTTSRWYDRHFVSGTDEARARAINRAFADPAVKALFAETGGSGTYRPYFLKGIDWDLIRKNPKIITGFSDITFLLNAIHKKTGLVTFHAGFPHAESRTMNAIKAFWLVLTQPARHFAIQKNNSRYKQAPGVWAAWGRAPFPKKPPMPYVPIVKGVAEGRLAGGNLSTIANAVGTPYQPDFDHKIVFLEDWYSGFEDLDRWFAQLINSGMLNKAKAIILGEFHRVDNIEMHWGQQFREFLRFARERGIPIGINFPMGHGRNNYPMPIGIRVRFDSRNGRLTFLESPTRPA